MPSHRAAMMRNMVRSLLVHQRIETSRARAKELRRLADAVITLGKDGTVHARRRAYAIIPDRDIIHKLFSEIAPLFKDRQGGYTRIIPLGFRRGDGAERALIELTEKKIVLKAPPKKAKAPAKDDEQKRTKAAPAGQTAEPKAPKKASAKEPSTEAAGAPEPKQKHAPRAKAKTDGKKGRKTTGPDRGAAPDQQGFMKNLRGFFRRKNDM